MASIRMLRAANLSLFLRHAPRHISQIPPPFLLPFAARHFNNTAPIVEGDSTANVPPRNAPSTGHDRLAYSDSPDTLFPQRPPPSPSGPAFSPRYNLSRAPPPRSATPIPLHSTEADFFTPTPQPPARSPLHITTSLRDNLQHLASQPPFYTTIHIHGKPYLVTTGDTIRLPFLMHGVMPGDVLRLDRASVLGSRDWTLRGGAPVIADPAAADDEVFTVAEPIVGKTEGLEKLLEQVQRTDEDVDRIRRPHSYLDDRLFVCRAVVMGTESEPMRIKEKTKQRQRRVKRVRSKHRYTVLKIREISVNSLPETSG